MLLKSEIDVKFKHNFLLQGNNMSKPHDKQFFVLIINSFVNAFLAFAKIFVGFLFSSQLLIADGIHSLSDLLTDFFYIVGLKLAKKPKDDVHPFGHSNLEYASSLIASVVIFIMVYELITEFLDDLPDLATSVSFFVLAVSAFTFIAKLLLSYYVLYQAKKLDSHTLENSGLESKADAYSTLIVIAGLLLTYVGLEYDILWLVYAEKVATLFIILILIKAASEIFFNSLVGIAGSIAPEEIKHKYTQKIETYLAETSCNFTLKDLIVIKQGIHYDLIVSINFEQSIPLKQASEEIAKFREFLNLDDTSKKVDIEFSASTS